MRKNKAFTIAELLLALLILSVVIIVLLQAVKIRKPSTNPFFVAAYRNLQKANEELVYKNEKFDNSGLPSDYCTKLSEMITTKNADCTTGTLALPNGVELRNVGDALMLDDTLNVSVVYVKKNISHTLTVYQATGDVVPEGANQTSTDLFKFRVFSDEKGQYIERTKEGISFHDAVCLIGSNGKYGINCNDVSVDTDSCPYPGMCRFEIVMPNGANFN